MRWYLALILAAAGVSGQLSRQQQAPQQEEDLLSQVDCEISEDGYLVPDPEQCDRYAECTPHGKLILRLCTDGYGLNLNSGKCDLRSKVDCTGRDKLQTPTGTGLCPRLNGNFPVPADVSCSEFIDCREGQPFMQSCGHGAVFDEIFGCVHPDETNRAGCTASEVLGFKCPPSTGEKKFGDHDRFAHPTDCALFYACLSTGKPRLLGCTNPKVFDEESGICKPQELVAGCEETYPPAEVDKDVQAAVREKIEKEIRAELEAKFGLSSGSLSGPLSSLDPPASRDEPPARSRTTAKPASRGRPRFSPPPAQEREEVQPIDLPVEDVEELTTTTKRPRRRPPIFNFGNRRRQ